MEIIFFAIIFFHSINCSSFIWNSYKSLKGWRLTVCCASTSFHTLWMTANTFYIEVSIKSFFLCVRKIENKNQKKNIVKQKRLDRKEIYVPHVATFVFAQWNHHVWMYEARKRALLLLYAHCACASCACSFAVRKKERKMVWYPGALDRSLLFAKKKCGWWHRV